MQTNLKQIQQKSFAIYGMGKSGIAALKKIKSFNNNIVCWDDNYKIRSKLKKKIPLKNFFNKNFKFKIDKIIISPGIDINKCKHKKFLKKNYKKIITDIDLFFAINKKGIIISITGTNGKSTTCKILEKVFKNAGYNVETGGNIGRPILSLKALKNRGIYILEISSYQLQYSKIFRSNHAVILNISPDHLERHISLTNYINIKSKIFYGQKNSDFSYINSHNSHSKKIIKNFFSKKIKSKLIKINDRDHNFISKKIKNNYLKLENNLENLKFVYKIVKKFNISNNQFFKSLKNFKGLPHRQEKIFSNKNMQIINDSKATSFKSCYYSLNAFDNILWILGGIPKNKDDFFLDKISNKIIKAYIIGKNCLHFKKQLSKKINHQICYNLHNAIEKVVKDIKSSNNMPCTVLFSPAAASFDQFRNFEDRGQSFKILIKKKLNLFHNV